MDDPVENRGRRYWTLRVSELYEGETPRIDWASLIPPGRGGRAQRSELISATKSALEAIIAAPSRGGASLSHATLVGRFGQLRSLVHWMVQNDIWSFSKLKPEHAFTYLRTIVPRKGSASPLSRHTLLRHLYIWRCLRDHRAVLKDGLSFEINWIEDELVLGLQPRESEPWRAIEDSEAIKLLQAAKEWTNTFSVYVGNLLERLWGEQGKIVGAKAGAVKRERKAFFDSLALEPNFRLLAEKLGKSGSPPYIVLKAAVHVLEGAALTQLLILVGLRSKELARLDSDCIIEPVDGNLDSLLLRGIAAKKGGIARTWAATTAVKEAVDALLVLLATPRKKSALQCLLLDGPVTRYGGARNPREIKRGSTKRIVYRLRKFVRTAFPKDKALVRRMHPHAARKTFARFVVKRDKRVLESLAHHFGHTHRAITDGYYVGSDIELSLLLDVENREDLAKSLADLISSTNIAGKAAKAFVESRQVASKLRGKAALRSTVERLISQGVQLAPCDWGFCVYSKALSACHGDATGPNEAERTADVCSGCANFAVTERHRAWWEERVSRDEEFLARTEAPEQAVNFVQRRLTRSTELLRELNASLINSRSVPMSKVIK